jgi:hypothetical protein
MSVFGVDTFSKTFNASIVADVVGKIKGGANKLLPPTKISPISQMTEEPKPEEEELNCGVHVGAWDEWSPCTYSLWYMSGRQYHTKKVKSTNADVRCNESVSDSAEVVQDSLKDQGRDVGRVGYTKDGYYLEEIIEHRNCTVATNEEEDPVDVDDGTITEDSTEEEPVDSSGDGESSTVEEEEQDDSTIGGGGSYENTDSEHLQDAIGGAISSAIDGFLMKALLGVGVIMGAGYAYENREEIKGYFKSVSKGKVA